MKNWTVKEAMQVINTGTDIEGIKEIASHFPMFYMAAARNDLSAFAELTTDKFTLGRLLKAPTSDVEDGVEDDTTEEAPAAGKKATKAAATTEDKPLDQMSTKELMKLCDARGIKVPHYGKNKQFYLDKLQNAGEDTEDVKATEAAETEADPYTGKTAKELFTMCKDRGIKAEPKKPAKVYVELLKKADAVEAESEDDEDWGEDEPETKPAPKANKGGSKAKKAPAKAKKAEEDEAEEDGEDDEWDI